MTKRTCTTDGCDRPHHARGLCGQHYGLQRGLGFDDDTRTCERDGCDKPYSSKGLCKNHAKRRRIELGLYTPKPHTSKHTCEQDSCDKMLYAKGLCKYHYKRHRIEQGIDTPKRYPSTTYYPRTSPTLEPDNSVSLVERWGNVQ